MKWVSTRFTHCRVLFEIQGEEKFLKRRVIKIKIKESKQITFLVTDN